MFSMSGDKMQTRSSGFATGTGKDHEYFKEGKARPGTPRPGSVLKPMEAVETPTLFGQKNELPCKLCDNLTKKSSTLMCSSCEYHFCRPCTKLDKPMFNAINEVSAITWFCDGCIGGIPGVHKLIMRVGNLEANYDKLEERVNKIEKEHMTTAEVKDLIKEEMAEQKEIEKRQFNIMCFNVPESKQSGIAGRQSEDKDFLLKLFDTKMQCAQREEDILKVVRLGKRTEEDGEIKCRPLRFTVDSYELKRNLIKASTALRTDEDEIFSNIYFMPDLTQKQRDEAFNLRKERRYRVNELNETGLKIRRGKIIKIPVDGQGAGGGPPVGSA